MAVLLCSDNISNDNRIELPYCHTSGYCKLCNTYNVDKNVHRFSRLCKPNLGRPFNKTCIAHRSVHINSSFSLKWNSCAYRARTKTKLKNCDLNDSSLSSLRKNVNGLLSVFISLLVLNKCIITVNGKINDGKQTIFNVNMNIKHFSTLYSLVEK